MHAAVTAVGRDRPGIIAAVTKVLLDHGANIEDSRSAILGGHFAMMLIVATDTAPATLEAALAEATEPLELLVSVRGVDEGPAVAGTTPDGESYVLSVYGADHPGIVHAVTATLADAGVNVGDLATHVSDGSEGDPPLYVMVMDLTLPATGDATALEAALRAIADESGLDISLRAADADLL